MVSGELSLSAFAVTACVLMVAGALLLLVLMLSLVSMPRAPGWGVPLLCPGSSGLLALLTLGERERGGIWGHGPLCGVQDFSVWAEK